PSHVVEAAGRRRRIEARGTQLALIEARARIEIFELLAIGGIVELALLGPSARFNLGLEHHALLPPRSYSMASSPWCDMRNPIGVSCSSARWPSMPAVRASSGMPLMIAGGKSRSSSTAAIGIEMFIGIGRPQASAVASRNCFASAT